MESQNIFPTTSDIVALASLFVAALAMLATFWQGCVARRHAQLSVRPHMDWGSTKFTGSPFKLNLFNYGLGPAIVVEFIVHLDGKTYKVGDNRTRDELASALNKEHGNLNWVLLTPGTPIAQGAEISLLTIAPEESEKGRELASKLIDRYTFCLTYKSFYNETFVLKYNQP